MKRNVENTGALLLIMCFIHISVVSCDGPEIYPEVIPLAGTWAKVDDSLLTEEYMLLQHGECEISYLDGQKLAYDKIIWGYDCESYYPAKYTLSYYYSEGYLYLNDVKEGSGKIVADTLFVGENRYLRVEEFRKEQYSSIKMASTSLTCGYSESEVSIGYELVNPLPWNTISASTEEDWISDFRFEDGLMKFRVAGTEKEREDKVIISYPNADDVTIGILQCADRFIQTENNVTLDYAAQEHRVKYSILNPAEGAALSISSTEDWIDSLIVTDTEIVFSVTDNNTGSSRSGNIVLEYAEADDRIMKVIQTYTAPEIILSPVNDTCDYTGGEHRISYNIVNPREGVEVDVTTNVHWIKNLRSEGGNLIFDVGINDNTIWRDGVITFDYLSLGTETYKMIQEGYLPKIELSPARISPDYIGGEYRFDYSIENPIGDAEICAESTVDWINNIRIESNQMVFNIDRNESILGRKGFIILDYNNYKIEYEILQSGDIVNLTDLSEAGTANCYIVSEAGRYKFKAVQGNSSVTVGEISLVEVLWETFGTSSTPLIGDLIQTVINEEEYVIFETDDYYLEGNALVAVKDISGKILWSWHIWFTERPEDQVYRNNAGTMMDRNLGATSATPGEAGALGLQYQWGRKDPFMGSSSINSGIMAAATIYMGGYVEMSSSTGTIEYATSHPTTFIADDSYISGDWLYEEDYSRWSSEKTKYDPCPVGYQVPTGGYYGLWSTAFGDGAWSDEYSDDIVNKGYDFGVSISNGLTEATSCWYPFTGRYNRWNYPSMVGEDGQYWSTSKYYGEVYTLWVSTEYVFDSASHEHLDDAMAVRCQKIEAE